MNDFTIEELEDILETVQGYYELVDRYPDSEEKLILEKIQSMIDNYCEHENMCEHDWGVGFGSIHSPVAYCKKCFCQKPVVPLDIFNKMMEVNK